MKRINSINKLGYPNSQVGKIVKKKSKTIEIQLPDDPEGFIRSIDRKSVEEICELEKLEPEKK